MCMCKNCIHNEVCGEEGHLDGSVVYCAQHIPDIPVGSQICPLLRGPCLRNKCVNFYMRNVDTRGFGIQVPTYGACSYFNINLDYKDEEEE